MTKGLNLYYQSKRVNVDLAGNQTLLLSNHYIKRYDTFKIIHIKNKMNVPTLLLYIYTYM